MRILLFLLAAAWLPAKAEEPCQVTFPTATFSIPYGPETGSALK